jgi:SNF2 family DNA or RNA helicase
MKFEPFPYQARARNRIIDTPHLILLADPGTGKTAIMLSILSMLKKAGEPVFPALVTSRRQIVTDTWPDEVKQWDQFRHLSFQLLRGPKKQKTLDTPADIYLITNESLTWLAKTGEMNRFKTLIIDESSFFKNPSAQRTRILKHAGPGFTRRYALTGSPTPHSMLDIFSQVLLIDGGKTLGKYITRFREKYFVDKGYDWPDWQIRPGAEQEIYEKIAPVCWRLDASETRELPPMIVNDIKVTLPRDAQEISDELISSLDLMSIVGGGNVYNIARQVAGGIGTQGAVLHTAKLEALDGLLSELNGKNTLVFYHFRKEGEALSKRLNAPRIDGGTNSAEASKLKTAWNEKRLPVLLLNPKVASHGLNLQFGGSTIIWYSLTDNQDDYYQANRRIYGRPSAVYPVRVHRLLAKGSVDKALVANLANREAGQKALLDAIGELQKDIEGRGQKRLQNEAIQDVLKIFSSDDEFN